MEYRKRLYDSYINSIYQNFNDLSERGYNKTVKCYKNYLKLLPKNKASRILDCGSGPGYFLYFLKKQGYTNAVGVDLCKQAVKIGTSMGLNLQYHDMFDFLKGCQNEYFDLIVAFDVLEHVMKDEVLKLLDLINSRLRKGGTVLIRVPNANSPFATRSRWNDFTHELSFTDESLTQILLSCGFIDIQIHGEKGVITSFLCLIRKILWFTAKCLYKAFMILGISREAIGVPLEYKIIGVGRKPSE